MSENKYAQIILGLLAKAEASEFPAEAETFLNKAMSLMAKHSIDEAMLDAQRTPEERTQVIMGDPILVPKPYDIHKADLLYQIALANGCHYFTRESYDWSSNRRSKVRHGIVSGTPSDIANVTTLFLSLLVQLDRELLRERDSWGNTKAHRINFISGFTAEISDRLARIKREAREAEEARVAEAGGLSESVGLALLDKDQFVKAKVDELYKERGITLRSVSRSMPSGGYGGYSAGRAAGARADLGGARLGSMKALGA